MFIRCSGKGKLSMVSEVSNASPIPKGYVRPLYPANWSPSWAKSQGWLKHPYYDWLQPSSSVEPVLPPKPEDKGGMSWVWWLVVVLVLVAVGYGGYWVYQRVVERRSTTFVDVDRAFMNMPMSMSMGPVDEMPNTTDLMNDLPIRHRWGERESP